MQLLINTGPKHMVSIYLMDTKDFQAGALGNTEHWYSGQERNRIDAFKNKNARLLYQAAHALKRHTLSCETGISPSGLSFSQTDEGKPFLIDQYKHTCQFSISHSGEVSCCAISSRSPIGVDVEKVVDIDPKHYKDLFSDYELKYISQDPEYFFKIWTLKEAYSKMLGYGLGLNFKEISLNIENGILTLQHKGMPEWPFYLWLYELPFSGYKMALSSSESTEPKLHFISSKTLTCASTMKARLTARSG